MDNTIPAARETKREGSMKYVVILALSAGMAGLLYGYDTVSISGAIEFLSAHYGLSAAMQGLVISSIMIGGVAGVGVSGFLADKIGRRKVLLIGAAFFFVSALASAFTYDPTSLIVTRIVGGVGIGLASALAITYITECAPTKYRGTLSSAYQLLTILGLFLTNLIDFFIANAGTHLWGENVGWRWMLGIGAIPAAIFFIALFLSPESPRFLLQQGKTKEGFEILERIGGTDDAKAQVSSIEKSLEEEKGSTFRDLFRKPLLYALLVGIFLAIFNQAVGQNTISYYGPTMFASIGFENNGEFIVSTVVGAVELLFAFVGMALIDRLGRKPLMQSGAFLMGVFAVLMALTYGMHWDGIWMLVFACGFIAAFAYSMGPMTWVMIPELFPTYLRGRAAGICTVFLWGINFCIGQFTPMMFAHWGWRRHVRILRGARFHLFPRRNLPRSRDEGQEPRGDRGLLEAQGGRQGQVSARIES
ncbi:sugar porter family MFS transporter [Bifidobacterium sp. AGR2158]|uniref:sugar porter family MFS transporter n=1 Tax=Bifidobacterium sp. AGR2158 TaxID=1280675 RepID=UPI00040E3F4D|nr:sugar porter family MFS transporter [Bifidobacterium sp. AGR2158]